MTYSLDLRKQALKYIKNVGTRKEAGVIFQLQPALYRTGFLEKDCRS